MRVVSIFLDKRRADSEKRLWLVWVNAQRLGVRARQRRFGPETGVVAQPEEFCLTHKLETILRWRAFQSILRDA